MKSLFLNLAVAALAGFSLASFAEERALDKEAMLTILTGNTAVGESEGGPWRQYFDADGSTPYIVKGREPDMGKWKITDDDKYMSWWEPSGWSTYTMTGEGDRVTWIAEQGGAEYPARMIEGKQLDFE